MYNEPPEPSPFPHGGGEDPSRKPPDDASQTQRIQHAPTSARVPEKLARGVMATGTLVIHGPQEFIIDFVAALGKPSVVARVVMLPQVAEQILAAMQENFNRYCSAFGQPPAMPKPPAGERPKSAQEIYDELKIPDDLLAGAYANQAMVGHTPAEFHIDFITGFFPHAAVSSRVYIAAPRMAQLIETLSMSVKQYRQSRGLPPAPPPPAQPGT